MIDVPQSYRVFQLTYAALAAQFLFPAISYAVRPDLAVAMMDQLNRALGGGAWPVESGEVWHMLAVSNVLTLAFLCALILSDLRRYFPVVPALMFLKGASATVSLAFAITKGLPAFYAVFVLDGVTTVVMGATAIRAHDDLCGRTPTRWWEAVLLGRAAAMRDAIDALVARGTIPRPLTGGELMYAQAYHRARLLFRSGTIGTSRRATRASLRARLLSWRVFRFPALIAEDALSLLDLTGLARRPDQLITHLLTAHHDQHQFHYDFELLAIHPGALDRLEGLAERVVRDDTPRTRWLRDLCVYDGYHEALLDAVRAWRADRLALTPEERVNPDITLTGFLRHCQSAAPVAG
jgi:hypothetical protein